MDSRGNPPYTLVSKDVGVGVVWGWDCGRRPLQADGSFAQEGKSWREMDFSLPAVI